MVICLERGADLHIAQLMPLPHTVPCFSKIQIGFTFLVPAHLGSSSRHIACVAPDEGPLNGCVCVCGIHQNNALSANNRRTCIGCHRWILGTMQKSTQRWMLSVINCQQLSVECQSNVAIASTCELSFIYAARQIIALSIPPLSD